MQRRDEGCCLGLLLQRIDVFYRSWRFSLRQIYAAVHATSLGLE